MDDPYGDDDPFGGDDAFLAAVDIDAMVSAGAGAAGGARGGGGSGGSGGGGGGGEEKSFSSAAANEDPYGGHDPNHDPFDDDDADPFASKGDAALATVDLDDPYGASGMGGVGGVGGMGSSSSSAPRALTPLLRSPPTNEEMRGTLSHFYGHPDFREGQTEVLSAVFEGRDVAVFWATGSGKSLMYQLPALHSGKTVLVVSPLISLMQDQVVQLNNTAGSRGTGAGGAGGGAGGGRSYPRGLACFLGR